MDAELKKKKKERNLGIMLRSKPSLISFTTTCLCLCMTSKGGETKTGTLSSPVVVEPGAVAGDDDVVCLLRHVVLTSVHQTIHLGFALFLIVLQEVSEEQGVSITLKTIYISIP